MKSLDLLIRNARIVDGSGNPWFHGSLAIAGDRIAWVGPRGSRQAPSHLDAREVVDAGGLVLSPGFIDPLSHSLIPLLNDGRSLSKIMQGVTTEIMGEGWTPAPFGGRIDEPFGKRINAKSHWHEKGRTWSRFRPWLEAVAAQGVSVNIGSFVGGSTIRSYARGWDMGRSSADELAIMCRVMAECMEDGAFGLSAALIYPPGSFADTDELVALARVVGSYGGVYITHVRSEAEQLVEGIGEAIEIGRRGNCAVEVYHLKASGEANWPLMEKAIASIEQARREGVDIVADMYPYTASGTGLSSLLPEWASEGNRLYDNLRDPGIRAKVRAEMLAGRGPRLTEADYVMPVGFKKEENKQYANKRLNEIAAMRGQEWPDAAIDLLLSEGQRIFTIYFTISEENIRRQMKLPWVSFGTDAGGLDPARDKSASHPRAYGTYPRILGKYVREEGVITLEDAIRKMSSAVAARMGIRQRGLLAAGCFADVILFDPDTIADRATFENPHQLSVGVRDVWVNGARILREGEHTRAAAGRIVDGPGRIQ